MARFKKFTRAEFATFRKVAQAISPHAKRYVLGHQTQNLVIREQAQQIKELQRLVREQHRQLLQSSFVSTVSPRCGCTVASGAIGTFRHAKGCRFYEEDGHGEPEHQPQAVAPPAGEP